ncbi:MAG: hypothetical protein A2293_09215 [Elusimicrobia bacterium RIFOXYB2_FULL_49_7]|nr:MAG: hypothetical protein A2293_09215 [Elusimicrobia bacterium RIFOXYB2_FULL_49_7]
MSECCGGGKTKVVYACSGSADVGEISDKTARALSKSGFAKMTCLAGVGADLSGFVESAKGADENIVIDGCPVACARKILEHAGVTPKSYILTEMGLIKGQTPVTEEVVQVVTRLIKGAKTCCDGDNSGARGCCCG